LPTTKYPIPAAEAQGAMIGDDYLVLSGFTMGYDIATPKNYALRLRDPNAQWRAMDDLPNPVKAGITHGAFAVVGLKIYMCGGYLGGHPVRFVIVVVVVVVVVVSNAPPTPTNRLTCKCS
jgi:N-acetylneuraminic acid mutarotase